MRGVPSCAAPVSPIRTPSKLTMSRSLIPGSGLPSGPVMLAAKTGNVISAIRLRKTALPKSNSWLPGTKMSGLRALVSATMCAPWSTPDISEGDSVSPPWANNTCAALGAFGLDHGGEAGEAAAALAVRHQRLAHLVDVVGEDDGELGALRPGRPLRHGERGGEAKRDGAAAKCMAIRSGGCSSTHRTMPGYAANMRHGSHEPA